MSPWRPLAVPVSSGAVPAPLGQAPERILELWQSPHTLFPLIQPVVTLPLASGLVSGSAVATGDARVGITNWALVGVPHVSGSDSSVDPAVRSTLSGYLAGPVAVAGAFTRA